jgi:hypothetical protein
MMEHIIETIHIDPQNNLLTKDLFPFPGSKFSRSILVLEVWTLDTLAYLNTEYDFTYSSILAGKIDRKATVRSL